MTIHLVTASDKNFGRHTGIMLMSLFNTQIGNCSVEVSILDGGIDSIDKEKISRVCSISGKPPTFISINNEAFGNAKIDGHISIATYYRVLLPELFPHLDKILYIDSDTIINASLQELWDTDIHEYFAAAVQDSGAHDEMHAHKLGLPDGTKYFNAGVLLINLKKWREYDVTKKLMTRIRSEQHLLKFWDQDALNAELWSHTKMLGPKFNLMVHFLKPDHQSIYTDRDITEAQKNPVIIHYNSGDKPWLKYCQNSMKKYYRSYWRVSEWRNIPLKSTPLILIIKSFLLSNLNQNQLKAIKFCKKLLLIVTR